MFGLKKTFLRSALALVGTIIGAGLFAVPSMVQRMGLVPASVIFWVVALLVMATHLLFVELISRMPERMRLPGYVGAVLGPRVKHLGTFIQTFQLIGAAFIYLILGGEFLFLIVQRFGVSTPVLAWQIVFCAVGAFCVYRGLHAMARLEAALSWVEVSLLTFMILFGLTRMEPGRLAQQDWSQPFAPVGVFLFALFGLTVIPEVHEIARRKIEWTRRIVFLGCLITAVLTYFFGVVMALATNPGVGRMEALIGVFPDPLWWVLPVFGVVTILTSFITLTFDLQAMYRFDLRRSRIESWGIALGGPLALLLFTSRDSLHAIDVVGSLFTASLALLVVLSAYEVMAFDAKPKPWWWRTFVPFAACTLFVTTIIQHLAAIAIH